MNYFFAALVILLSLTVYGVLGEEKPPVEQDGKRGFKPPIRYPPTKPKTFSV